MKGVQSESQQSRREHQPFHIQNQRHESADRQRALLQLATTEGQQEEKGDRGNSLQEGKQSAAGFGQLDRGIAVAAIPRTEGIEFLIFLVVDLDGSDA